MIKIEIGKENFLTRRNNNIFSCGSDSFGNSYCPNNLAKADSYWDYDPGYSVAKTGSVVDYANKVANVFYVAFNLGLQDYKCTIPGDQYSNFECKGYGYVNVSSIKYVIGIDTSAYSGAFSPIYGYFRVIKTCPTGTVQEGNQCKGINYVCPAGYTDNGTNCQKTVEYSYYNYLCNSSINTQGFNYAPTNTGGNCNKTDPNNSTSNPELSNPCNSPTPPANNCKREGFKCNSNEMKPAFVDGEWKCSPFFCDGNLKCGYGTCDAPSAPSLSKYQDIAYNPLKTNNSNQCNGDICDFVVNAKVSYCESSQCPKRDDIIEKDGKCYKLECPKGTYLSGEKCIKANY